MANAADDKFAPGTPIRYIGPPLPYRTNGTNHGVVADNPGTDPRFVWIDLGGDSAHPVRRVLVRLEGEW